jgi:hypothetical protein
MTQSYQVPGVSMIIEHQITTPQGGDVTMSFIQFYDEAGQVIAVGDLKPFPVKIVFGKVEISGSSAIEVIFHDVATVVGDGEVITVDGHKTLTIEIYGTSVSRTIAFKGVGPSGIPREITGEKLSDLNVAVSTTGSGELWQFNITGLIFVIMELTAVAGGNVSVKGVMVA